MGWKDFDVGNVGWAWYDINKKKIPWQVWVWENEKDAWNYIPPNYRDFIVVVEAVGDGEKWIPKEGK